MRGLKKYRHPVSGTVYTYHRKSGRRILAKEGTPEFFEQIAAAETSVRPPAEAKPGTLGVLIEAYRYATTGFARAVWPTMTRR